MTMRALWPVGALAALLLWAPGAAAQAVPLSEDCESCHLEQDDERLVAPARDFPTDVHYEVGFGCLACHGGVSPATLDPGSGFLSAPQRRRIPEMCGRCHSDFQYMRQFDPNMRVDQVTEYWSSRHGQLLQENDDPDVAVCIDCHPAHQIRPPDDPESSVYPANVPETCGRCHSDEERMAGRDIPTDQVDQHASSIHGVLLYEEGDLSAPVCNDCHGNHGAAPPGLGSVRMVCGECHAVMAEFFDESDHGEFFQDEDLPLCATCHEHHAVQPVDEVTLTERSAEVCSRCHTPTDPAGHAFDGMAALLDSLSLAAADARHRLEEAEALGVEVSQALFELEDVNNASVRARSAIHTLSVDAVREQASAGFEITDAASENADAAFAEYDFRRFGLGISAGIILLLMVGLLLKIRDMEERIEAVLGSIAAFYGRAMSSAWAGSPTPEQIRLTAAALMIEAAYADGRFTDDERHHLEELMRWRFGLVEREAEELIDLAERQRASVGEVGALAELLAEDLGVEQKRLLLEELWVMVYSDGELSKRELEFLEDVAKLLHVDEYELAEARRRAIDIPWTTSSGGTTEAE